MKRRDRHFSFKLKDAFARRMNRQQYKFATRYIRWVSWRFDNMIDWDVFEKHLIDVMLFGKSDITYEDMLI